VAAGDGAGGGVVAEGAAEAAAGTSAGGGAADGHTAQPMPTTAKRAAPTAGNQRGVFGSGS
jgi:hypothetical protein